MSEIMAVAHGLNERGMSLVMGAFNNRGDLITLRINEDAVHLVDEQGFGHAWFRKWSRDYPFKYSERPIDALPWQGDRDIVFQSLDGGLLASFPVRPTLVVFESELCSIPSNLLNVNGQLAGETAPIASAPSLAWLAASFRASRKGNGQLKAWISNGGEAHQTLNVLVDNLRQTFADHGVDFNAGEQVPSNWHGSDLVLIAAHGQVSPDGKYFHTVTDEGVLQIPAEDLANALRNVRVVVLFVCSGGRSDKTPGANTTTGLARQLLGAGCSTVVASPWPIEAITALAWVPSFLEHWKNGRSVVDACFYANKSISGDNPARTLAMNVFGDPFQMYL